jgi:hypothetical protein
VTPGPWRPLACLAGQVLLLWGAAAAVDVGGLTPDGSGPYLFAAAGLTIGWSSWGLVATFVTGLVGRLAGDPDVQRGAAWFGAVVSVPFGLLGLVAAVAWLAGTTYAADVLMAAALAIGGVLPLLPLVGLLRARRTA